MRDVSGDLQMTIQVRPEAACATGYVVLEQGARRIDCRRIACRARADDDELGVRMGHQEISKENARSGRPSERR